MKQPIWTTACPDWEQRIIDGRSLIPFDPLFPEQGYAALEVFKAFPLVDVVGSPLVADVTRQWVYDLVMAIFGSYNPRTGHRLIREILLLISKKNTKSTMAALIMLTVLVMNWRESAEFAIIAPTIKIAGNSFKPARDAIKKNPVLSKRFSVQDHTRTITDRTNGATLSIFAADSDTVGGGKFAVVLIEELWLLGKQAKAEDMLREATGGLASRPEGFVMKITTQSDEPPAGVYKQELDYARGVRDGLIHDPNYLPVLYEFPKRYLETGAYKNPKNFYMTNPNLGASVDVAFLEREHKKAEQKGAESVNGFFAKHLNVEIGLNLRTDRWAGADFWEAAGDKRITLAYLLEHAEVITAGIDGGGLDDLLGLCLAGRHKVTKQRMLWFHAWAHKIVLERRKDIESALLDFEKDGDLTIVELPGQDVTELADILCQVKDAGLFPEKNAIGVDPAGISDITDELTEEERGFTMDQIVAISQGYKLNGAIKSTERQISSKETIHDGSRMMAWCVGNAKIQQAGNAILVTKQASGTAKIDPLMAGYSAVTLMGLNPQAMATQSIYEQGVTI